VDRSQLLNTARTNVADLSRGNLGVPLLLLVMLAMMMLPIPPFLLDVFFTFNIALSIVVLLVCVYALRPLDFAVFPTILLVATLLRLALNVASTRVVMLHGQDGHASAGKVIQAFGNRRISGADLFALKTVGIFTFPFIGFAIFCGPAWLSIYYSTPCDVFYLVYKATSSSQLPALKSTSYKLQFSTRRRLLDKVLIVIAAEQF
jgi:hypothetical protein